MGPYASSDGSSFDVFISYNSADSAVVEKVAGKLREKGLRPFYDQ
jgi:hypothetical protein